METHDSSQYKHIKGWGVDADPRNEPTYPMKHYTGDDHRRLNWERPMQQLETEEILHSNERPTVSAVFGAPLPPKGLSGAIRRYAFKYSESSFNHWLPLLLADRVDVIEGLLDDARRGRLPNIFAEKGWKAAWKYNRKGVIKKLAFQAVVVSAIVAICWTKKSRHKRNGGY